MWPANTKLFLKLHDPPTQSVFQGPWHLNTPGRVIISSPSLLFLVTCNFHLHLSKFLNFSFSLSPDKQAILLMILKIFISSFHTLNSPFLSTGDSTPSPTVRALPGYSWIPPHKNAIILKKTFPCLISLLC